MTQDNYTGHFYPIPPRKSYNPFDSDDDTLESPGLKSENVNTKEDSIGFDLKAFEKSADALTFDMDNGDFLWEEAIFSLPVVNVSANGHTGSFEKDGQLYTDKNVTECELPEFKSIYQSVKDIGIDDWVPTHDKIRFQNSEDESCKSNDAMNVEKDSDESDVLEARKSKLGGDWQNDAALHPNEDPRVDGLNQEMLSGQYLVHEFGDDDSQKITELKLDLDACASTPAETDSNKDASEKGEPDFMGKDGAGHDDTVEKKGNNISLDKGNNFVVQKPTTGKTPSKLQTDHGEDAKLDQSPNEGENLPKSSEHVAEQSAYNRDSNMMTHNGNLKSGSITLDLNSSTNSDPRKQEDDPQNVQVAKPPTIQTTAKHEEGTSSNSVLANPEPRVHGETSFSCSIPVHLPSSITFSGPVAYSGSLSLRSESSAGSTRSFAFPILQTEWNSSPVRMAKADQRHLRKHRRWVQALVCCRF